MRTEGFTTQLVLVIVVIGMAISANLPEGMLERWSINRDVLLVGLGLVLVVALVRYVQFALVLVVAILAIGANLPAELANQFGTSPTVLTATLAITVLLALLNYVLRFLPTGTELTADRGETTTQGAEALITSTRRGDVRYMRALLRLGVAPSMPGNDGETALTTAARRGYADAVQLLLQYGADPTMPNRAGELPQDLAREQGYTRSADLIDVHIRFPDRTPVREQEALEPGRDAKAAAEPEAAERPS